MADTKSEILDSALRILNQSGLSGLSVRAVAQDLGLSPGNVSYHFRKKESLVAALATRLAERNVRQLAHEIDDVPGFLELFRSLFHGQYAFRGLHLALPDVLATFADIRAAYRGRERARRRSVLGLLLRLRAGGALDASDDELSRLVSKLTFVARFWIAESTVSYPDATEDELVAHYLALLADDLYAYATADARAQLASYLEGLIAPDDRAAP